MNNKLSEQCNSAFPVDLYWEGSCRRLAVDEAKKGYRTSRWLHLWFFLNMDGC